MSTTKALSTFIEEFCYDSNVINSAEFVTRVKSLVESGADVNVDIHPGDPEITDNALIYFLGAYYEIKYDSDDFPIDPSRVEDLIYYFLEKNAIVTAYAIAIANHYEDVHMLEELLKRSTEPHYLTSFTRRTLSVFEGFDEAPADYDLIKGFVEPNEDDDEDMIEDMMASSTERLSHTIASIQRRVGDDV